LERSGERINIPAPSRAAHCRNATYQNHTRSGEAALKWEAGGRSEALLLRGDELAAAKAWLAAQPQFAPEPTLLHHEFIKAADDVEAARTSAERQRLDQMAASLEREKAAQDAS
jgi:hypothetical protein